MTWKICGYIFFWIQNRHRTTESSKVKHFAALEMHLSKMMFSAHQMQCATCITASLVKVILTKSVVNRYALTCKLRHFRRNPCLHRGIMGQRRNRLRCGPESMSSSTTYGGKEWGARGKTQRMNNCMGKYTFSKRPKELKIRTIYRWLLFHTHSTRAHTHTRNSRRRKDEVCFWEWNCFYSITVFLSGTWQNNKKNSTNHNAITTNYSSENWVRVWDQSAQCT